MKITLLTGPTFNLEEQVGFPIKVVKSALTKRLTLRIDEKTRIPVLTVPVRCSLRRAVGFVEEHRDWITNMLARVPLAKAFENNDIIYILGKTYQIIHQPDSRGGVFIENDKLIVSGNKEFLHRRVTDFLKKTAHDKFLVASKAQAAKLNCTIHNVVIKDTKSRWGSCSNKNNINYNWRVIMAPQHVFDYLVCHEVSHLLHQDHSAAFWNCVASLCPSYKEGRAWLKTKGRHLYQYL